MNLFQLRAFDAVSREGSFTRAAKRLSISQPAVTGHVKALEERYDLILFRRTARSAELTPQGEALAALTRPLFGLVEQAEDLLLANRALVTGRIEVAADSPHVVMPLLARLRARHPGITVGLSLGNAAETYEALLAERASIGVVTEAARRDELHMEELAVSHVCAVLPRDHALATGAPIDLAALDRQSMVLREPTSVTRRTFDRACRARGIEPAVLMELDSREAVIEAAAAGIGIGIVSSLECGEDGRIRAVPITGADLSNRHAIVCLARRRSLRLIRAVLDLAVEGQPIGERP
ncbi:transcriptional regulator [Methylobacterium gregans]|uniref:HTH-type transcriptional regulator CysL n=1 Tax=Methylobacterium gregans TaxID=374424 RepID=A0AA37HLZ7_9HYPH|nr:LysR substrate-binding domain-containing protein [Methylobacterium gregans]MDQ0523639.1 aminoethylphosphonate catabolism LysR family transcriptional regulator [Methylobacterium gregans]GJD78229.1 HTH-type transcriptional regulator CysL [Methylobacterium gregans]GLS55554.1 transcriptional regulator [Methylobacterium gregans]